MHDTQLDEGRPKGIHVRIAVRIGAGLGNLPGMARLLRENRGELAVARTVSVADQKKGHQDQLAQKPPAPSDSSDPSGSSDLSDYEYRACVVWSDAPHGGLGDLEDSESIESFTNAGWELVNVIVPFAGMTQLSISYPGNTRKLIAYFRRPVEGRRHEPAA